MPSASFPDKVSICYTEKKNESSMLHRPTNLTPLHLIKILSNIHKVFQEEHKMILLINHTGLGIFL